MTKYTLTFGTTSWEATQSVMAAKLTRLTHKIAIQLHLVAESCTIYSSGSRRPVRKRLDTPSYPNDIDWKLLNKCSRHEFLLSSSSFLILSPDAGMASWHFKIRTVGKLGTVYCCSCVYHEVTLWILYDLQFEGKEETTVILGSGRVVSPCPVVTLACSINDTALIFMAYWSRKFTVMKTNPEHK
jgi:hypothetical protein